eukprot:jgi/Bigna1/73616/fgenesh1_pg.25_\
MLQFHSFLSLFLSLSLSLSLSLALSANPNWPTPTLIPTPSPPSHARASRKGGKKKSNKSKGFTMQVVRQWAKAEANVMSQESLKAKRRMLSTPASRARARLASASTPKHPHEFLWLCVAWKSTLTAGQFLQGTQRGEASPREPADSEEAIGLDADPPKPNRLSSPTCPSFDELRSLIPTFSCQRWDSKLHTEALPRLIEH